MFYTLDAKALMLPQEYRLQRNGDLIKIEKETWRIRSARDLIYRDYEKLLNDWDTIEKQRNIAVDGRVLSLTESAVELLGRYNLFPRLHRVRRPNIPRQGELKIVIAKGDKSEDCVLYIDREGRFHLGEQDLEEDAKAKLYPVAVRYDTFKAGDDKVGLSMAQNDRFIQEIYLAMLQGWYSHLSTGELDQFVNSSTSRKESDILSDIERIVSQFNFAN